jgi:hypothetical protein
MSSIFHTDKFLEAAEGTPARDPPSSPRDSSQMTEQQINRMWAQRIRDSAPLLPDEPVEVNMQLAAPPVDLSPPTLQQMVNMYDTDISSPSQMPQQGSSSQVLPPLHESLRRTLPDTPSHLLPPELPSIPVSAPMGVDIPVSPSPNPAREKSRRKKSKPVSKPAAPSPPHTIPSTPHGTGTQAGDTAPPEALIVRRSSHNRRRSFAADIAPIAPASPKQVTAPKKQPAKQPAKRGPAKGKTVLEGSLVQENDNH